MELIRQGSIQPGFVVSTGYQHSGKGQRGNAWESEDMENILISVVIRPHCVSPTQQFLISMAAACGIHSFLRDQSIEAKVKWPNDIMIGNKKVSGILIENLLKGDRIDYSVIGIGLNVNQEIFSIPTATSIKIETGAESELGIQLSALFEHLDTYFIHLENENFKLIEESYLRSLYRLDEVHQYKVGNRTFEGTIVGVNLQGQLLLSSSGVVSKYSFKEIEYII